MVKSILIGKDIERTLHIMKIVCEMYGRKPTVKEYFEVVRHG